MALLREDSEFTHIIAIDFGTGASGFLLILHFFNSDKFLIKVME